MVWGGKNLSLVLLYPLTNEDEPGKVVLRQIPRKKDWLVRLVPARQWRQPETRVRLLVANSPAKQNQTVEPAKLAGAKFIGVWELSTDLWLKPRQIKAAGWVGEGLYLLAVIDRHNKPVGVYAGYYAPMLLQNSMLGGSIK